MHVWWKQVELYSIGLANQKAVLSTASMSMLLLGGFRGMPLRKFLNQVLTGLWLEHAWFLKLLLCGRLYVCLCMCVHPRGY